MVGDGMDRTAFDPGLLSVNEKISLWWLQGARVGGSSTELTSWMSESALEVKISAGVGDTLPVVAFVAQVCSVASCHRHYGPMLL